ncbi:HAMP domain-containing sensor histidine kinase [Curtobacterium sp. MCPF17_031]|uniref:sensor histidine kinase n=1 Tax=Curtobacterium sp. MCPF17_031 TaxID=2175653 RepID=UPI000DA7D75A|nr:ATP-binding protein [Curtobacterium sp. MCPF17_031]PZE35680.1 two-component sensor histidine kinase [Curtobacterium sp. MCPF17_031]
MRHAWSIRTRTALAFAVTSMALAAAAIIVVNLGSQASLGQVVLERQADGSGGGQAGTVAAVTVSAVADLQWRWTVLGVAGAGVLAGATGWVLARRMLAPVDRITATARRLSASTLHERLGLDGPDDELRRLSRTIDELLDRLEASFASQRRFVAQAAHELRTPLAVQRAAIQIGLPDDAGPDEVSAARTELLEQNRRTEHLVESLLVLAEAERDLGGQTASVDLAATTAEVVAEHVRAATDAGVTLTWRTVGEPPGRTVLAEPVLFRQLLRNLVDNALEYNVPGGFVHVDVTAGTLTVENSGPLLTAGAMATLTEPFRRAPGTVARSGRRHSGLGLSIVAAVVQAHGWSLAVDPRVAGGLTVRVHAGSAADGVSSVSPPGDR